MRIKREELLRQLETVAPGLATKEIIEQSNCFIFQDGKVQTFNDEVGCSSECCLKITGAVRAKPLLEMLRKLSEDQVAVELKDGKLLVKGKRKRASFTMEEEVTLPVEGIESPTEWNELPEGFIDGLGFVRLCASKDESQMVLCNVHLRPDGMEACDNFQVMYYPIKTGLTESVLVRAEVLKDVIGLGMEEVSVVESWVHFRNSMGAMMSCRRCQDEYPKVGAILTVDGTPTVLPEGLESAVSKAEIFSSEDSEDNQVIVELKPKRLMLIGVGPSGEYKEQQKVEYDGREMEFRIAPKLLVEISKKGNQCEVAEGRLKVKTDRFTFVCCTGVVEEEDE